jgi:hypothetical protein
MFPWRIIFLVRKLPCGDVAHTNDKIFRIRRYDAGFAFYGAYNINGPVVRHCTRTAQVHQNNAEEK